jgi:hypothetical protein
MPANGPTALNDIVIRKLVDALKRGNTRVNACRLARVSSRSFTEWLKKGCEGREDYVEFALRVRDAEAFAEDEAMERIREGALGWQGMAWWLQRRNRARWADITPAAEKAKLLQAANSNAHALDEVPLADLEQAIQDAAELKRAEAANIKKTGTKE